MLDQVFRLGFLKGLKKVGVQLPQAPKLFKTMPPAHNLTTVRKAFKDIQPVRTSITGRTKGESLKPATTQSIPKPPSVF